MSIENSFEESYLKELEVQKEVERIEIAYTKTLEKYKAYEECAGFVHYVKTLEKVFTEAKIRNWDADRSKEELIRIKIDMLAAESHLEKEIFQSIYDDFKKANMDIGKIKGAAEAMFAKYQEEECCEFIAYIEYVLINFQSSAKMEDIKEGLIKSRMETLSSDGHPEIGLLEEIYNDFNNQLKGEK